MGLARVDHDRGDTRAASIAAAVEPASPPPMIAMWMYLIRIPARKHLFCAGNGK
jgi:hypothetical protein